MKRAMPFLYQVHSGNPLLTFNECNGHVIYGPPNSRSHFLPSEEAGGSRSRVVAILGIGSHVLARDSFVSMAREHITALGRAEE